MGGKRKTKSNVLQVVPFFMVSNIETSLDFYIKGLKFKMTREWIDRGKLRWCWMRLGKAALMLQEMPSEGRHSWIPDGKLGVGASTYFICSDALKVYKDARLRGINMTTPIVGNGMWVASVTDPDGYQLFFESPTRMPEETQYSE